tara:strand:+ start:983 stop:1291 length:309 start_codon:yes stop_codon:yes gene_type:complete
MKQSVSEYDFIDAFRNYFGGQYKTNFSYEGLKALFEYFEEFENDTGEEMELDVIAICCDFSEYESLKEYNEYYDKEYEEIDEIADDTTLIKIDDERFIIQQY